MALDGTRGVASGMHVPEEATHLGRKMVCSSCRSELENPVTPRLSLCTPWVQSAFSSNSLIPKHEESRPTEV